MNKRSSKTKLKAEGRVMRLGTDGEQIKVTLGAIIHDMGVLMQRLNVLAGYADWCLTTLGNEDYLKKKAEAQAKAEAAQRGEQITDAGIVVPTNAGKIVLTDGGQ